MTATTLAAPIAADWRDFLALTKPRVMRSVVFTGLCGMLVAPGSLPFPIALTAILAIALAAGAAGTLNQWYEADIDARMKRTAKRPLPAGRIDADSALHFGVGVGVFSVLLMGLVVNLVAAALLAASILFYVIVYTIGLKRFTPQNIVIGGAAGAFPPLIGWVAVTGTVAPLPLLMFALIFLWTPPHSWALALLIRDDYAKGGVPMMPVVAGARSTRWQMLGYAVAMAAVAIAPWPLGLTGSLYGWTSIATTALFGLLALQVATRMASDGDPMKPEKRLFAYSIVYLFAVFGMLVIDMAVMR